MTFTQRIALPFALAGAMAASGCQMAKQYVGEKTGADASAATELQGSTNVQFATLASAMLGTLPESRQGVLIIRGDMNDVATSSDVLDPASMEAFKGATVVLVGQTGDAEARLSAALGAENVKTIPSAWDSEVSQDEETRRKLAKAAGIEIMKVVSGAGDTATVIAIVPKDMGDLKQDGLPEAIRARNVAVATVDVDSTDGYEAEMAAGAGMFTAYTADNETVGVFYDPEAGTVHYTNGVPESTKKMIDTMTDPKDPAPDAPVPTPGE